MRSLPGGRAEWCGASLYRALYHWGPDEIRYFGAICHRWFAADSRYSRFCEEQNISDLRAAQHAGGLS
jgi:hypothetical protein